MIAGHYAMIAPHLMSWINSWPPAATLRATLRKFLESIEPPPPTDTPRPSAIPTRVSSKHTLGMGVSLFNELYQLPSRLYGNAEYAWEHESHENPLERMESFPVSLTVTSSGTGRHGLDSEKR